MTRYRRVFLLLAFVFVSVAHASFVASSEPPCECDNDVIHGALMVNAKACDCRKPKPVDDVHGALKCDCGDDVHGVLLHGRCECKKEPEVEVDEAEDTEQEREEEAEVEDKDDDDDDDKDSKAANVQVQKKAAVLDMDGQLAEAKKLNAKRKAEATTKPKFHKLIKAEIAKDGEAQRAAAQKLNAKRKAEATTKPKFHKPTKAEIAKDGEAQRAAAQKLNAKRQTQGAKSLTSGPLKPTKSPQKTTSGAAKQVAKAKRQLKVTDKVTHQKVAAREAALQAAIESGDEDAIRKAETALSVTRKIVGVIRQSAKTALTKAAADVKVSGRAQGHVHVGKKGISAKAGAKGQGSIGGQQQTTGGHKKAAQKVVVQVAAPTFSVAIEPTGEFLNRWNHLKHQQTLVNLDVEHAQTEVAMITKGLAEVRLSNQQMKQALGDTWSNSKEALAAMKDVRTRVKLLEKRKATLKAAQAKATSLGKVAQALQVTARAQHQLKPAQDKLDSALALRKSTVEYQLTKRLKGKTVTAEVKTIALRMDSQLFEKMMQFQSQIVSASVESKSLRKQLQKLTKKNLGKVLPKPAVKKLAKAKPVAILAASTAAYMLANKLSATALTTAGVVLMAADKAVLAAEIKYYSTALKHGILSSKAKKQAKAIRKTKKNLAKIRKPIAKIEKSIEGVRLVAELAKRAIKADVQVKAMTAMLKLASKVHPKVVVKMFKYADKMSDADRKMAAQVSVRKSTSDRKTATSSDLTVSSPIAAHNAAVLAAVTALATAEFKFKAAKTQCARTCKAVGFSMPKAKKTEVTFQAKLHKLTTVLATVSGRPDAPTNEAVKAAVKALDAALEAVKTAEQHHAGMAAAQSARAAATAASPCPELITAEATAMQKVMDAAAQAQATKALLKSKKAAMRNSIKKAFKKFVKGKALKKLTQAKALAVVLPATLVSTQAHSTLEVIQKSTQKPFEVAEKALDVAKMTYLGVVWLEGKDSPNAKKLLKAYKKAQNALKKVRKPIVLAELLVAKIDKVKATAMAILEMMPAERKATFMYKLALRHHATALQALLQADAQASALKGASAAVLKHQAAFVSTHAAAKLAVKKAMRAVKAVLATDNGEVVVSLPSEEDDN